MRPDLFTLFNTLSTTETPNKISEAYAAVEFPDKPECYIVKDSEGFAHVMINSPSGDRNSRLSKVTLKDLRVLHDIRCTLQKSGTEVKSNFTDIQCLNKDEETVFFFLYACNNIISLISERPSRSEISAAVMKLASLFERSRKPNNRSVKGLFGELFIISESSNPEFLIASWRVGEISTFDFSHEDYYLEVKTTSSKERSHVFSYEQCNPPKGTAAFVASVFVEESAQGWTIPDLIERIEARISPNASLIFKLRDNVYQTVGKSYREIKEIRFDQNLSKSSVAFYDLTEIPAIRDIGIPGVTNVHFKSNLSLCKSLTKADIRDLNYF